MKLKLLIPIIFSVLLLGFTLHQDVFAATCSDFTDETSCNASSFCAWESNMCVISLPSDGTLTVTKDASPSTIDLAGSGGQEQTTITIDVQGISLDQNLETIFLMDSSGSVGSSGWQIEKDFVNNIIQTSLPDSTDPVGIIRFSNSAIVDHHLIDNQDRNVLQNLVNSLNFISSTTATRDAVQAGINEFNTNGVSNAPKLMLLITDGNPFPSSSQNPCTAPSLKTQLDSNAIKVVIIGVGNNWNPSLISCLVDDPSTDIIFVSSFSAGLFNQIKSQIDAQIIAANAASNVNLVETTQSHIIDEDNFSIPPDSISTLLGGQTQLVWNNIAQHVGDNNDRLSIDETFTVSFTAKSNQPGVDLEVNDLTESTITFNDPNGSPMSVDLPQALITVIDPFPTITVPSDITEEATGPNGANVDFVVTGNDANDGALTPTCDANTGDLFPLGTTPVNCSVTDSSGNTVNDSFTITVQDTIPPTLDLPADITQEAEGPNTRVFFDTSATDIVDGTVTPVCSATSGDTFPLGTTPITCTATDNAGNTADSFFDIFIEDTTAPELTVPGDISTSTGDPNGTEVFFDTFATDLVDGDITPTCDVSSGFVFPIGTTTVNCSVTDNAGNTADSFFDVIVELSYKGQKEAQISFLEALTDDAPKKTHKDLEKAIKSIEKSIDDKLWETDVTLTEKHGHKVFDEEKSAVKDLLKIQKDDDSTDVSQVIKALVDVDRELAQDAIDAATVFAGDKKVDKELEKANDEMKKAQEELDDDKPDKAIDKFKKAWEHAQKAIKHATK
ncbi:HYR domain-containing protein [Nitrosopumilus adriaticus]|uniref:Uncharacterized protein n=1 Tax=Nitrosopumilus adriaticus TaxID=1580092 RepID=A0A0D5C1Q7_9ARCH|nr:HYR domain-containing protein [Nitrosopumilus adriaticus]AJW70265.1 exported protein of unknown function [Nitrosopumilus adriaticus]